MLTLSQVIYGVQDLDAATRQVEALGLMVIDGGYHPGPGTANRIVPWCFRRSSAVAKEPNENAHW